MLNRKILENHCSEILTIAKKSVKAFIFDFDGTIKSSTEPGCNPIELIDKIVASGKSVGIVTASSVSALLGLAEQLKNAYLGIANGMALYKINDHGIKELYRYSINMEEVNKIINAWRNVMSKVELRDEDLVEKGLNTFREFLLKDWEGYISKEWLDISREYNGRCFVEEMKATFVMPKDDIFSQEKFIRLMQEELNSAFGEGKYIINMGDTTFAHVTVYPGMAPKLFALKRIQKELELNDEEIAAFGDMPYGNDRGLLIDSNLPYTFTNKFVEKDVVSTPPFILPESELTPVASVFNTVNNLLN